MRFIESLKLAGLLSFPPDMEPFELESLNVLIGPNGSGKSNFIEAFELLRALPTDFAAALRQGGRVREWIWKGEPQARNVQISLTASVPLLSLLLRRSTIDYFIEFSEVSDHASISKEIVSRSNPLDNDKDPTVCYSRDNKAALILEQENGSNSYREFEPTDISYDQSIMAQLRHPAKYHEITWLARQLYFAQIFREWSFGRNAGLRKPQQADLPGNRLLADASNLALIVNQVENWGKWQEFNELLKRFFPRFERLSTSVIGGTVQLLLHEKGFDTPIPATRISDGTLRFIAMLAVLLSPEPPPLVCIEEPELGLHPDAVMLMGDILKEASERMQLVVTTHSNALISAFSDRANAVVTCERRGAGTVLRRLDPNELADLLEDHTLGHLWRQGELGANP